MTRADEIFERFPDFIREFIYTNTWDSLRPVQMVAAHTLFETDRNLLLTSSTASGKTEAVFFPVNRLLRTCSANVGCQSLVIENLLTIVAERNLLYERKCGHLSHRTTREKLLSFLSEQSAEQKR